MNPYINSDAAIMRGEKIEAMISEVKKDGCLSITDAWLVLETLRNEEAISDDELDDLVFNLTERTA